MLLFSFLMCKSRFVVLVGTFLLSNDKKRAGEACVIKKTQLVSTDSLIAAP